MASASFQTVRQTTLCPYARRANVSYGPDWLEELPAAANFDRFAAALAEWASTAFDGRSHGFVLEVGIEDATDFEEVRRTFKWAMAELNARDPAESECLEMEIDDEFWQYEFADVRLFSNVFAPCYPVGHSRYWPNPRRVFLLFQPEFGFAFCNITRHSRVAKAFVREIFREGGSPYSGELVDLHQEAYLYMLPVEPEGERITWWVD